MSAEPSTVTFDTSTLELLGLFDQYKAVIYVQLGIVIWEYLTTAPWEWSVLTGRKPFRKPMVIFFAARYSMWFAIIPNLIQLRTGSSTDCRAVFDTLTVGATLQVVFGQLVFILRCLAIWEWAPWVITVFLAEMLPYIAFSFAIFQGTKTTTAPDLTPGMISCQISDYGWPFLVAYGMCVVVDLTTAGLMTWKVLSIRNTLRSSMLQMFLREGLAYSALGLVPAIIALAFFGKNENAAVRGAGLTLCSLLHAILGCRAFISLDLYAERLPTSLQVRVKNGEMLDADTLARIAFHTGLPANSGAGDELGQSGGGGGGGAGGRGGGHPDDKSPWAIRLARLGQKFSSSHEEKHGAVGLNSGPDTRGGGPDPNMSGGMRTDSPTELGSPHVGFGGLVDRTRSRTGGSTKTSTGSFSVPHQHQPQPPPQPRYPNAPFAGAQGTPNLDGIIISEQQVVEEEDGDDDLDHAYLSSPLTSWDQHLHQHPTGAGPVTTTPAAAATVARLTYGTGGGRDGGASPIAGRERMTSTISYEEAEYKEDLRRSP
ncbi:hypothetical protein V8E36_006504 [Tilletia maclaganii]